MKYKKEIEYLLGDEFATKSVMPISEYRDECEIYNRYGEYFVDTKNMSLKELAWNLSDLGDGMRRIDEKRYNEIVGRANKKNDTEWTDEEIKKWCEKHPGQTFEQLKAEMERAKNL